MITVELLRTAARDLGLAGRAVMVHASLRSFGRPVERGPDGLIDALLGLGCTVVVPAFTWERFATVPPPDLRPGRNAYDYSRVPEEGTGPGAGPVYRPDCGVVDAAMGAVPAALIAREGMVRGRHPLCSFAALGPDAARLLAGQGPGDVYAPIREVAARGGAVLLVGVGLTRMTALHLAEQLSGRRLLVRWARVPGGRVAMVEAGGCSEGFGNLAPHLDPLASTADVGLSRWRAFPAADTLPVAAAAIAAQPDVTSCPEGCDRCRDLAAGGPIGQAALG